jgi:serine/threonine protein kinase
MTVFRYWMAPEVIMCEHSASNSYDNKCDIWSIGKCAQSFNYQTPFLTFDRITGVTAIELADKVPPLADLHPMRALALIPTSKLSVAQPKKFSTTFIEFIDLCLTKDPRTRPSAEELMNHPFLEKMSSSKRTNVLLDLIRKVKQVRMSEGQGVVEMDEDDFDNFDSVNTRLTAPTMSTVPVMPTVTGTVKVSVLLI